MGNAKGFAVQGPVKFLRRQRAQAEALLPPELLHYLTDHVRGSAWYPEADFAALIRAAARLLPGPSDRVLETMGELGAQEHAGVYADLLLGAGSSSRTFALWSTQHDTGELLMHPEGTGALRFELVDFADPSREICLLSTGYLRGVLRLNGREGGSVEELSCRVLGDALCAWRATWKGE